MTCNKSESSHSDGTISRASGHIVRTRSASRRVASATAGQVRAPRQGNAPIIRGWVQSALISEHRIALTLQNINLTFARPPPKDRGQRPTTISLRNRPRKATRRGCAGSSGWPLHRLTVSRGISMCLKSSQSQKSHAPSAPSRAPDPASRAPNLTLPIPRLASHPSHQFQSALKIASPQIRSQLRYAQEVVSNSRQVISNGISQISSKPQRPHDSPDRPKGWPRPVHLPRLASVPPILQPRRLTLIRPPVPTVIRRQPTAPPVPPAERAASILIPLLVAAPSPEPPIPAFSRPRTRNRVSIAYDELAPLSPSPRSARSIPVRNPHAAVQPDPKTPKHPTTARRRNVAGQKEGPDHRLVADRRGLDAHRAGFSRRITAS